jgi:uncharacterized membrane protein YdbT with pleckstrin-like domain
MWRTSPLRYALLWLIVLAGLAFATWAARLDEPVARNVYAGLGLAVVLLAALVLLGWYVASWSTCLTIGDDTVILSHGLIAKRTSEVRIADIRNVTVDQSVMQRIFHVGSLGISSAGQSDVEILVAGLPHPDHLAELIRNRARELSEPAGKD